MDFAHLQADPGRRCTSLAAVAALHLLLGWLLAIGLAWHGPELLRQTPIVTKLVKPEPPPPPSAPQQPQLLTAPSLAPPPPPRFVPPPEFEVTQLPEATVAASPIPHSVAGTGTETAMPQKGSGAPGTGLGNGTSGQSKTPPQLDFSKCPLPHYPDLDVEGTTLVVFVMDVDGTIPDAGVGKSSGPSSRHKMLDRLAVEFVLSCRGIPGTVNGKPVPLRGFTSVDWSLKR